MPVSFNSPPRNFFLLGSGAQQALTNFFDTINRAGSDRFNASDIAYSDVDQKYILAGSGKDSNTVSFGWLEKQAYDADTDPLNPTNVEDWRQVFVDPLSVSPAGTTLNFMKQTASYGGDIIIGGKTGSVPWIAEYNSSGVQQWVSTSQSGDVEYFGVACTSNGYYACGHKTGVGIDAVGFVEKWDVNGSPLWGKSAFHVNGSVKYNAIAANDRGEVVVVGSVTDQAYIQGYVAKLNAYTGEVLWDKTINSGRSPSLGFKHDVEVNNIYIDGNDQIYVVGTEFADIVPTYKKGFIIKYSAEGNLIWHKTTPSFENHDFIDLWSDTPVEQTVVLSRETFQSTSNSNLSLIKYSKNGDVVFRRRIITDTAIVQPTAGLDGDPSFYYMLFVEEADDVAAATSKNYTFGKVSASGNGFGAFTYETHHLGREIDYRVNTNTPNNPIGRLADGSVRNDSSDFISYPYSGLNLLLGDDLATNVAYKKTRHKEKDLFEYSGSPAQRVVDFTELNIGSETKTVTTTTGGQVQGQQAYTTAGTYTWTAPANVTSVSVVCVGAGGGAGGALAYKNNITVVPGTGYSVVVGSPGVSSGAGNAFSEGGDSSFTATLATIARGGKGTSSGSNNKGTPGGDYDGGGNGGGSYLNGGYNGGGAGGYSGDGGTAIIGGAGGSGAISQGAGSGGAGGAGAWAYYSGGGVGILGEGASGTGGVTNGTGGSGGQDGQGEGSNGANSQTGGNYGGGGSGRWSGNTGGKGAVRIIWGSGREFPSTNTADVTPSSGPTTTTVTKVVDQSSNGFEGIVDGATQDANGHWDFDGTDDFISFPESSSFSFADDFTVESWIYPTSSVVFATIFSTEDFEFKLQFLAVRIYTSSGSNTTATCNLNEWNHVLFYRRGSTFYVSINGVEQTVTPPAFTGDGSSAAEMGRKMRNQGEHFIGKIAEVRVYPRALTSTEISQNYNATKSKYINEAPSTAPRISSDGIVYDSSLLLNYDFNNRVTYDNVENLFKNNNFADLVDYNSTANGNFSFNKGPTNSTAGPNVISPVGDLTGGTIVYDGTDASAGGIAWSYKDTAASADQNQIQFVDGDVVTYSVYAKIGSSNNAIKGIYLRTYSPETAHAFYLDSGTKAGSFNENSASAAISSAIEDVGNGWYRCSITLNITANDEIGFQLYLTNAAGSTGFNDASGAGDTIHAWGAQVERHNSAGRLIRTYGTAITASNKVKNLSGSLFTGTLASTDTPAYVPEPYGYFRSTAGNVDNTGGIVVPAAGLPSGSDPRTMEAWVYMDSLGSSSNPVFFSYGTAAAGQQSGLRFVGTGLQVSFWTAAYDFNTGSNPGLNVWFHYVATYNGSTIEAYLNGSSIGTKTVTLNTVVATNLTFFYINDGADPANHYPHNGRIGEARIYDKALTATEVLQNFNATRSKYGI